MSNSVVSLKDLLEKNKRFVIPYYQRGYIWGKSHPDGSKDSVSYILDSINKSFKNRSELFLQGITVTENEESITLIDGQQRMTFFFLLLHYLGLENTGYKFSIEYTIREESQKFLENLQKNNPEKMSELCAENKKENFQDIFYFKKTVRSIEKVGIKTKKELLDFLLENVKFLYVPILEENATKVFSMMNGQKAIMKDGELVKAEILRLISPEEMNASQDKDKVWEQDVLRARFAREWDRWLYWWNRDDVREFYHTEEVMGWLLVAYFKSKSKKADYNFQNFHEDCLSNSGKTARRVFYELRALQKKFEDVFNSVTDEKKLHNKIGAILCVSSKDDRKQFIIDYFAKEKITDTEAKKEISDIKIEQYYKYVFLGLKHTEILNCVKKSKRTESADKNKGKDENEDKLRIQIEETHKALDDDDLYNNDDEKEYAFWQLLRLNVEEDTKLGRAFDFSIWKNRSLEHIMVKSRFSEEEKEVGHSIGNLVLLYKNDNSSFSVKPFLEKKRAYFDCDGMRTFQSRTLLHSMSVFASEDWGVKEIQDNKKKIIESVEEYYKEELENTNGKKTGRLR